VGVYIRDVVESCWHVESGSMFSVGVFGVVQEGCYCVSAQDQTNGTSFEPGRKVVFRVWVLSRLKRHLLHRAQHADVHERGALSRVQDLRTT
jgi:hypothetical protein